MPKKKKPNKNKERGNIPNPMEMSIDELLHRSNVKVIEHASRFMFGTDLGDKMVEEVLPDVKEILAEENARDYADHLAGQFHRGKQVKIEPSHVGKYESLQNVCAAIQTISSAYVERFVNRAFKGSRSFKGNVELHDMWANEQSAGDWNPLHSHGTASPAGLSGVLYLESPKELLDFSLENGSETKHGWVQLVYGQQVMPDLTNFRLPENLIIPPTPGTLILFPKDQAHQVFPYLCEGKRINIAFNVNVWYRQRGMTAWSDNLIRLHEASEKKSSKKEE